MADRYYIRYIGSPGRHSYYVALKEEVEQMKREGKTPQIVLVAEDAPWYKFVVTYKNLHKRLVVWKDGREEIEPTHPLSDGLSPDELVKQYNKFLKDNGK